MSREILYFTSVWSVDVSTVVDVKSTAAYWLNGLNKLKVSPCELFRMT